jgi:hypothetical protein
MSNKELFIKFVQIYCTYLMRDDERLDREESKSVARNATDFFKESAIYKCMNCGNRSGLSFIEKKHICSNPMFNENGIPILTRVKEMCNLYGFEFEELQKTVRIKGRQHTPCQSGKDTEHDIK